MEYDGEPVTETQKCGSGPFWSEWSAWNKACGAVSSSLKSRKIKNAFRKMEAEIFGEIESA